MSKTTSHSSNSISLADSADCWLALKWNQMKWNQPNQHWYKVYLTQYNQNLHSINPLKHNGISWLHLKLLTAIQV